jgi:NTP pyrophosphatase (non-canonical NTP hydrolase)
VAIDKTFQTEVHAVARTKGWWDEPREFGTLIALCHSELSEAWQADVDNVATELGDVVIRILDLAEYYGLNVTEVKSRDLGDYDESFFLCELHLLLSQALEEARKDNRKEVVQTYLGNVVSEILAYDYRVEEAIYRKHEFNKTRPHKHGGKAF